MTIFRRLRRRSWKDFLRLGKSPDHPLDPVLFITTMGLLIFSLIMMTSIGVPKSIQLSAPDVLYPNCSSEEVDCYLILKNHATRIGVGLLCFLAVIRIHYSSWKRSSLFFFAVAFCLLLMVIFFGSDNNTFARSWLSVGNIPLLQSIQPTEIAKLALIVYLASWLEKKQREKEIQLFDRGFIAFCVVSLIIMFPVILQPDLGSSMILACIAVGMYFVSGADWKHIALGTLIAVSLSAIAVASSDHLNKRFSAYWQPNEECAEDYCWQSEQAKIAVGSGGFWGQGLTQGIQKSYWLPQASDDFIFAASAEEIGFLRISLVVVAYCLILYRGFQISNYAPDEFSRLTAAGITIWLTFQAFINIAVNIALMPVTGITLPFVSYGGSSMVMTLVAMGVLLNISQYTKHRAYAPEWRRNSRPRIASYRRR